MATLVKRIDGTLEKLSAVAIELACPRIIDEECVVPVSDNYSSILF
jgi:hypothetical protein